MAKIMGIGGDLPEVEVTATRKKKAGVGDYLPIFVGGILGIGSMYVEGPIKWALRAAAVTPLIIKGMSKKKDDPKQEQTPPPVTPQTPTASGKNSKEKRYNKYKQGYLDLWNTMVIRPDKMAEIDRVIDRNFVKNYNRYYQLSFGFKFPWFFLGLVHFLEANNNFSKHLHNGDPLTDKTKNVPANRPVAPPANGRVYTWEESALDAIALTGLNLETDWSLPRMLFILEGYNGFGYRTKGINSPYLWSFSNHHTKGKYVADGVYDANAISLQIGCAVLLRRMLDRGIIKPKELKQTV